MNPDTALISRNIGSLPIETPGADPKEKPEVEPEKLPDEDPGIQPGKHPGEEDDDEDDPYPEPEIGDDPDTIKIKTPMMTWVF